MNYAAVVSDNEKYVAATNTVSFNITVWDLETGNVKWTLPNQYTSQQSTCWTRDSTRLMVTSALSTIGPLVVTCWDIEQNSIVWTDTTNGGIVSGIMNEDGNHIIYHEAGSTNLGRYEVWEFPDFRLVHKSDSITSRYLVVSDDGKELVVTNGGLFILHADDGALQQIDSLGGGIAGCVSSEYLYRWGFRDGAGFMQKLQFDWNTTVEEPDPFKLVGLFPNPCSNQGHVEYNLISSQMVSIDLFDALGRHVLKLAYGIQIGHQSIAFDCSTLSTGAYLCILEISGKRHSIPVQINGTGGVLK